MSLGNCETNVYYNSNTSFERHFVIEHHVEYNKSKVKTMHTEIQQQSLVLSEIKGGAELVLELSHIRTYVGIHYTVNF